MDYELENLWLDVHNSQSLMQMRCYDSTKGNQVAIMNYNFVDNERESRSYITNFDFVEKFDPAICKLMFTRLAEEVSPDFDFVSDKLSEKEKQIISAVAYPAIDSHAVDILSSVSKIRAKLKPYPKEISKLSSEGFDEVEKNLAILDKFEDNFAKLSTIYSFKVIPSNPKTAGIALRVAKESFENMSMISANPQLCVLDTLNNGKPLTFFSKDNLRKIHKSLSSPYKMLTEQITNFQNRKRKSVQR